MIETFFVSMTLFFAFFCLSYDINRSDDSFREHRNKNVQQSQNFLGFVKQMRIF